MYYVPPSSLMLLHLGLQHSGDDHGGVNLQPNPPGRGKDPIAEYRPTPEFSVKPAICVASEVDVLSPYGELERYKQGIGRVTHTVEYLRLWNATNSKSGRSSVCVCIRSNLCGWN